MKDNTARKWTVRAVILLGCVGAAFAFQTVTKKKPIQVRVVTVQKGTVRDVVTSSTAGELMPGQKATIRAELGAKVVAVKHRRGDRVKKNELILLLDTADLDARLQQAKTTIAAQEAQLQQAKARADSLAKIAARAKLLSDKGAGTMQLTEDSQSQASEALEAVKAADSMVETSRAALRVAQVARQKAALTAPFDGLLTEVRADPGDQLAPGAPVLEIIDDSRLYVDASVDEMDLGKVHVDQPATLRFDALPGKEVQGHVARMAPSVKRDLKGARILPIEVDVNDLEAARKVGLRPGMSANVEIVASEKPNVLCLPTNVIIGRGVKRQVYVITEDQQHVKLLEVELGVTNWDRSEVLKGVSAGQQVVATLNMKDLADGARVEVAAEPPDSSSASAKP